jgi:ATP-dependent Clp protease ATP-binding subunit ClpA
MTPRLQEVIRTAQALLTDANQGTIGVEHVMMAILDDPRAIPTQVLAKFVEPARVQRELRSLVASEEYRAGNTMSLPQP